MNWLARAIAIVLGAASALHAAEPMTFAEISLRVRMGEPAQTIVQDTARRKLLQPLTGDQESALKKAGVDDRWIAAFRSPTLLALPEEIAAYNQRKGISVPSAGEPPGSSPEPSAGSPQPPGEDAQKEDPDLIKAGDIAPDFEARGVGDKLLSLHPLRGRVILLVLFATWSAPSTKELKAIEDLIWSRYQSDGLAVIAMGSGDTVEGLIKFKKEQGLGFDLAEDPQKKVTALYATDLIPRCYVIDREGLVKFSSTGFNRQNFIRMTNIIISELRH